MFVSMGQFDAIVTSSREAAEEILQHKGLQFADRPQILGVEIIIYGGSDITFSPCEPYFKQLRKLCLIEILSTECTRSFAAILAEETLNFVRDIAREELKPVRLTPRLFSLFNAIICRAALGRRRDHRECFLQLIRGAFKHGSGLCMADMFPSLRFLDPLLGTKGQMERIHQQLDVILMEIIEKHRSNTSPAGRIEDLIDVLLRLKDDHDLETSLSMNNVKAVILDMFLAGTETSSTLLEWCLSELTRHPEIMERAQVEVREVARGKSEVEESDIVDLHFLKLVLKETLRLHPPLPMVLRQCRESCEVMGYTIKAGTHVFINMWALRRDLRYWDEPERFKPERFEGRAIDYKGRDFQYLPFSGGSRFCPGMGFGMVTVEQALARLLFHFDWELPNVMKPDELDMSKTMGLVAQRKNELQLIPKIKILVPGLTTK